MEGPQGLRVLPAQPVVLDLRGQQVPPVPLERPDQLVPPGLMVVRVLPALPVPPELLVQLVLREQMDHPAPPALLEQQEPRVLPDLQALTEQQVLRAPLGRLAQLVLQEQTEQPVLRAPRGLQDQPGRLGLPDPLVLVLLVLQALLEALGPQVLLERTGLLVQPDQLLKVRQDLQVPQVPQELVALDLRRGTLSL